MGSRARSARSGFQNNGMERGKAGKAAADFCHAPAGLLELPRKRDVPPPAPGTSDGSAIRDSPQSVGGVSTFRFLVSASPSPAPPCRKMKLETRNYVPSDAGSLRIYETACGECRARTP